MAKPEWGTKRLCTSCGARFYDLGRQPIECPKCHTVIDPEQTTRLKRSRSAPPDETAKAKSAKSAKSAKADEAEEDLELEGDEDLEDVDEDDDSVLEDASDLGDDEELDEIVDEVDTNKEKDSD